MKVDFFNGNEYARMKLTPELLERGILDIIVNKEPRQISISYLHQGKQMPPLVIPILEFPWPTIDQLDTLVNGTMELLTKDYVKIFVIKNLSEFWNQIYVPPVGSNALEKQRSASTKIEIALDVSKKHTQKLFKDEYKTTYAAIPIEENLQVLPINGKSFKNWIRKTVYQQNRIVLDGQTLNDICGLLSAQAEFEGEEIPLSLRTASMVKNNEVDWIYDLTNKMWEFLKITSSGWYIVKNCIIFRRYNNQQSQVNPSKEYDPKIFDSFMKLFNIKEEDEDAKLLLKCYIASLFIPDIQKVILMLQGSQGSAKSSLQELIKMLVDPSIMKTLTFPRDTNEFLQQLSHNYIAFYDNISKIPEWSSDLLCRAVSGSASSNRQLYTDDDDVIRSFKRSVGFNGINLGATKPDLLDRGLIVKLQAIEPHKRRKPEDIWRQFEQIRPQLLGYILDVLVKVLNWKNNGTPLNLDGLPRMSEFAEYGEMISRVMGYNENAFINAYYKNIELQSEEVIESSEVAACLIFMMFEKYGDKNNDNRLEWKGTPTALLGELKVVAEDANVDIDINARNFPKSASVLSKRINEILPNLKSIGLKIEWSKEKKKRIITISKVPSPRLPSL